MKITFATFYPCLAVFFCRVNGVLVYTKPGDSQRQIVPFFPLRNMLRKISQAKFGTMTGVWGTNPQSVQKTISTGLVYNKPVLSQGLISFLTLFSQHLKPTSKEKKNAVLPTIPCASVCLLSSTVGLLLPLLGCPSSKTSARSSVTFGVAFQGRQYKQNCDEPLQ